MMMVDEPGSVDCSSVSLFLWFKLVFYGIFKLSVCGEVCLKSI